jgi:hypothetical protein
MGENNIITKQLLFSLITGEVYEIESDELKNMDKYQIPLVRRPSHSCRKCHGRMHIGFNPKTKVYELCNSCVRKCVDFKKFYGEHIDIETIKHA